MRISDCSSDVCSSDRGAVFLFRVLDGVEAHLLSIRALEEAAWLARIRGSIEEAYRGTGGTWFLSKDFIARVGHYVYTAALVELTGRGRLPARQIRILPGQDRKSTRLNSSH